MVKRNIFALSLALSAIVNSGFPIFAQSATSLGDKEVIAKSKVAIAHKGNDVLKEEKIAKQWFKKAADQGDKEAKEKLASLEHKAQPEATPPK